jgi:hypothetical protein
MRFPTHQLATPARFGYGAPVMGIANAQNMVRSIPVLPQPYGIRVRLRRGDPFAKLLGGDWQRTHWYFTAAERDRMLEEMSRKHEYSRIGDQPALVFEKVEKLAESRNF